MQNHAHKLRVLSLFKKILKSKNQFEPQDQEYVREEAFKLFKLNKNTENPEEIESQIFEAESRLELALHYKVPQPRLFHIPKGDFAKHKQCIIPAYMYSTTQKFQGRNLYEKEQDY